MDSVGERANTTWLRVGDVARPLGVSGNTVRRWTDAWRIAAYRSPGGHRRYLAEDVHALLSEEEVAGATAHLRADRRASLRRLRASGRPAAARRLRRRRRARRKPHRRFVGAGRLAAGERRTRHPVGGRLRR